MRGKCGSRMCCGCGVSVHRGGGGNGLTVDAYLAADDMFELHCYVCVAVLATCKE